MNFPKTYDCSTCGKPAKQASYGWSQTLVGYLSEPGHDHDDNCVSTVFTCPEGHRMNISVRRTCPNPECDWKGKDECFCHEGKKVEIDD